MTNTMAIALVCCCYLISVITIFITYFGNKSAFDSNKGAAAGLWIACIFFTFTVIAMIVASYMPSQEMQLME